MKTPKKDTPKGGFIPSSEKEEWVHLGMQGLSMAYGSDEPDYANVQVKEPNPEYIPLNQAPTGC